MFLYKSIISWPTVDDFFWLEMKLSLTSCSDVAQICKTFAALENKTCYDVELYFASTTHTMPCCRLVQLDLQSIATSCGGQNIAPPRNNNFTLFSRPLRKCKIYILWLRRWKRFGAARFLIVQTQIASLATAAVLFDTMHLLWTRVDIKKLLFRENSCVFYPDHMLVP